MDPQIRIRTKISWIRNTASTGTYLVRWRPILFCNNNNVGKCFQNSQNYNFSGALVSCIPTTQCWGLGSIGSVCFLASRVLPSSSKNSKKKPWFLLFCFLLLYDFLSLKNDVNVPAFRIRIRMICTFLDLSDPHPDPLVRGKDPRIRICKKCHGSPILLRRWQQLSLMRTIQ